MYIYRIFCLAHLARSRTFKIKFKFKAWQKEMFIKCLLNKHLNFIELELLMM